MLNSGVQKLAQSRATNGDGVGAGLVPVDVPVDVPVVALVAGEPDAEEVVGTGLVDEEVEDAVMLNQFTISRTTTPINVTDLDVTGPLQEKVMLVLSAGLLCVIVDCAPPPQTLYWVFVSRFEKLPTRTPLSTA